MARDHIKKMMLTCRVKPSEHSYLKLQAKTSGLSLSDYMRDMLELNGEEQ